MKAAQQEAEAGYKEFRSLGAEWAWKFLILDARALYHQSRYDEVLSSLRAESTKPPSTELAVRKLWLEGLVYTSLHDFTNAEQQFLATEPLCRTSDLQVCANVASARGTLEMERGRYPEGEAFFTQVLGPARASGDQLWIANAMLDLSWSADEQAHFDEALDWATDASRIAEQHSFAVVSEKALGNIGWAYYKLGERDRAVRMFNEAEVLAGKIGEVSDQTSWITDAGYSHMDDGDFGMAVDSFRRSLEVARNSNSREDIINSLIALAFVSEQTGKIDDAKHYSDEALAMARADGNKRDETYPRLVQGRIAARAHDFDTAETAFHEVAASIDSPVFLKWEAERSLARMYEDENQLAQADHEYRTALSTFEAARAELQHENSRLPFLNNATRIYDDYIHLLVSQGKIEQALQVADYSRARTLSEGLGLLKKTSVFQPDVLHAREIARSAGGTIFFYWLGEKQSYLWAVTPQKISLFTLPGASKIDAAVQRYRRALLGPEDPVEVSNADGLELYRVLVAPASDILPKKPTDTGDTNGHRVFIIPDGSLNTLNFETLLAPDPKPHYWIEEVTIADASSLRLLGRPERPALASLGDGAMPPTPLHSPGLKGARIAPPVHNPGELLLLGNAVAANADYPELRKAGVEMESIQKHFGSNQERVFMREQATPDAYLASQPAQFSYIHFVAHGTASRMNPLDSAIVLSAANKQEDSFKLYARDIIQQPLRANLVTISTCYGAGARAYSGEGLVGLSWAFLRAGAHNVIGALWEVSDVSTPKLMDDLYGELEKGRSPDAALRAAKLALLHSGGSFRRPFYWAPFQLYAGS